MIKKHCWQKLVDHISRDATAIESHENPVKVPITPSDPKRKPGRPCKDEAYATKPLNRAELQAERSLNENLSDLPTICNVGTKKNYKGYKTT
jgi:hypothetical protein